MTYCVKKKLLFIHIPKNAGRSIEELLKVVSEQELRFYRYRPFLSRVGTFLQREFSDRKARERLYGTVDVALCSQHLTLQEIELLGLLSADSLKAAFKFAVVRNPYERAVSTYRHFRPHDKPSKKGFFDFWKRSLSSTPPDHNVRAHLRRQSDFIVNCSGHIGVDAILRFENLSEELNILRRFGVDPQELKVIGSASAISRAFHDLYDEQSRELIEKYFSVDIEQFGYRFAAKL